MDDLECHFLQAHPGHGQASAPTHWRGVLTLRESSELLCLGMPRLNGFDIARQLRTEFADRQSMQIVAVTG